MARKPRRTRMDCAFNWATEKVQGRRILPPVTRQPIDNFCGAHAAVEAFEARARLLNARVNQPFPTLSILHLIDQLRDASNNAVTEADKRRIASEETAFELLKNNGVVTKEDYDAAPDGEGFTKNVQGLKHYRIQGYKVCYTKSNQLQARYLRTRQTTKNDPAQVDPLKYALGEISLNGPVYGWFVLHQDFAFAKRGIYRAPEATGAGTHALMLFGFGARGGRSAMFYQNNWGNRYHVNGRGLMETNSIVAMIIPTVERNWDN